VAVFVAIGLVAHHFWMRRPAQDWPLGFDADRPMPPAELPDADRSQPPLRWPVFEKVALISLVSIVFSLMLGVDAGGWQIVVAVGIVVMANAGISAGLARRGTEWASIGLEFLVLTVINALLLSVIAEVVGDGIDRSLSLFFGYLLTMIIVLYDRFRARHFERIEALPAT
jgi:hypothetical protein